MEEPSTAVEVNRLTKWFGNRQAADSISFEVRPGEILGLLGHNGAGKSTLIGCLLGQVFPSAGSIRIFGHDVFDERRSALSQVGAIFETPCFYGYMSGWDNLKLFTNYTGIVPEADIHEMIERVGIADRIRDRVETYSHGMRQRLALAQALLPRPRLLVLDEPGDGLDPEGIVEIRELIARLNREMKLAILVCSHQLSEVEQICHRVVILREGKRVFYGDWRDAGAERSLLDLDADDPAAACAELEEAGLIVPAPGGWTLAEGSSIRQVFQRLGSSKLDVRRVGLRRPDLEELYISLTRGEGNSGGSV